MPIDPGTLQNAANEIRLEATKMRARLALADHLESLAAIENAINEARTRLAHAHEMEEEQKVAFGRQVDAHRSHLAEITAEAESQIRQRHALADADIASKRAAADTESTGRVAEAARMLDDARVSAAKIVNDAEASTKQHRDEVMSLKQESLLLEAHREGLKHDIALKEEAHQEVVDKLAATEAKHAAAISSYQTWLESLAR